MVRQDPQCSRSEQARCLNELWRVTSKTLFVTTPDRGFPVEFHTVLPLVHWLPAPWFRAFPRRTGRGFFAGEANLNLMGHADLARAAAAIPAALVDHVRLWGWPSNLLLIARRAGPWAGENRSHRPELSCMRRGAAQ